MASDKVITLEQIKNETVDLVIFLHFSPCDFLEIYFLNFVLSDDWD